MAGIGHELFALEVVGENLLAESDGLLLVGLVQAAGLPGFLGGLDDEGRGLVVELVDMGLEPAMLGAHEIEGEGLVHLVRAQPDEAVRTHDDIGLEHVLVLGADLGVHTVAGDDQVGIGVVEVRIDIGLEHQLHIERFAARLQDVEQMLAADAHEAVAARADDLALEQQFDVVPVIERFLDLRRRHGVPLAHVVHGRVGKHHSPPEGVIGLVAFDDRDVVRGIELLHQQRKVQTCGAAADTDNFHGLHPLGRAEITLYLNY